MQNLDQITSVAADFAYLDELDRMIQAHIPVVKKRLGNSMMKHLIYASTPTFPGYATSALFNKSDGREWFIKCDGCGERQSLTMESNVFGKEKGPAFFGCRKCKKPIDQTKPGEWVAARPGAELRGYHISKLMSPTSSPQELLDSAAEDKGTHFNFDLGLPYARAGGKLNDEMLNACRGSHEGTQTGTKTVLGIDVGKRLHCVLGVPEIGSDSKGNPTVKAAKVLDFFEVDEFEELDGIMRSGDVFAAVIDALPETRKAKEFAQRWAGKVWIAYYTDTPAKEAFAFPKDKDKKKRQIDIDRTQSLDRTFGGIIDRTISIPADAETIPDAYPHLCAPIRVTERDAKSGNMRARYDEFGKPDHYAHALNYMIAASWIKAKKSARRILKAGVVS